MSENYNEATHRKARKNNPRKDLMLADAEPCPFCGYQPVIEYWHGGGPGKRAVHCVYDYCPAGPMVTGGSRKTALLHWNYRP